MAQHSPARAARACCQAVGFTLRRCLPSSEGPMRSEEGPRQLCGKDCLFQHRVSRPSGAFLRLPQRGNAAGEDDPSPPGDLPHRHLLRCLLGISAPSGSACCHADTLCDNIRECAFVKYAQPPSWHRSRSFPRLPRHAGKPIGFPDLPATRQACAFSLARKRDPAVGVYTGMQDPKPDGKIDQDRLSPLRSACRGTLPIVCYFCIDFLMILC